MSKGLYKSLGGSLAVLGAVLCSFVLGWAAENKGDSVADQLLSSGRIGAKAVDFTVVIERLSGGSASSQQTPVLKLTVAKDAYVTAVYIAPNGDVIVLMPNRETPDNLFRAGKRYSLFGSDSKVKLVSAGDQTKAKIVFYVSSSPIKLDPLSIPDGKDFIAIRSSDAKDIELLRSRISSMASDEGFNHKVVALKDESGQEEGLGLMGLPTDVKSDRPQSVTGVQGVKGKESDSQKE